MVRPVLNLSDNCLLNELLQLAERLALLRGLKLTHSDGAVEYQYRHENLYVAATLPKRRIQLSLDCGMDNFSYAVYHHDLPEGWSSFTDDEYVSTINLMRALMILDYLSEV